MRKLLYPLAWLYRLVVFLRNSAYDAGIFSSYSAAVPTVVVGNLEVGGTGKTPMVEYLMQLWSTSKVVYLSRGYGRKSRGLKWVTEGMEAAQIGDEASQIRRKFPKAHVVVCEKRVEAMNAIERQLPDTEAVVLDDAFQHRAIAPHLSILLTRYDRLFLDDELVPVGRLREPASGAHRADVIVVTKSPQDLSDAECYRIRARLSEFDRQQIFFATQAHQKVQHLAGPEPKDIKSVLALTGIAHSQGFIDHLQAQFDQVEHHEYGDHHWFNDRDIERVLSYLHGAPNSALVTTEKDAQRLRKYIENGTFASIPVMVVPVAIQFLFDSESRFNKTVHDLLRKHQGHGRIH